MPSIERRPVKSGISYRVVWREGGVKQQQTFPTEKAAMRFYHLVKAADERWPEGWVKGKGFIADQDSTAPLFAAYAEKTINARQKADERTKDDYKRILANHINPVIGNVPVDRIDRFQVSAISDAMAKEREVRDEHGKPVIGKDGRAIIKPPSSVKTISNVHALLSSILTDAVTDRIIDRNPAVGAMPQLPDSKTEEMVFLSPTEFAVLLDQVQGWREKALVQMLAGTGLRWSEATALQVHDLDLDVRQAVDVRRAWKRRGSTFILGSPKTNRSRRSLGLSHELVLALAPLTAGRDPGEFLFTTQQGHVVRHNNFFNRVWKPAVLNARHAGLPKAPRIHDLRHTHASWLIAEKVSLPAIQRRLGHESITTTIDRYGHLAPEHVDEINAAIDRALRPRGE
jgi:integrase